MKILIILITLSVSQNGKDLIKKHEGLSLDVYICPSGQKTIGYGHANTSLTSITKYEAEMLLDKDLDKIEKLLNTYNFNQSQFDALASFIYNVGEGNFKKSTFIKTLDVNELRRWVYSNGKVLKGLKKRRDEEIYLYNNWYDNHFFRWIHNGKMHSKKGECEIYKG